MLLKTEDQSYINTDLVEEFALNGIHLVAKHASAPQKVIFRGTNQAVLDHLIDIICQGFVKADIQSIADEVKNGPTKTV